MRMRFMFTADEMRYSCQAKKHPSVPRGYKCVAMKNCVDRKQNVVLGPVKSTGYCGSRGLQALNTCVAVKK